MNDLAKLTMFAKRYAEAWCSQTPKNVAAFFAENGSLTVNDGPLAVGRAAIAEVARGFMTTFPDMVVTMDDVSHEPELGGRSSCDAVFHWTLTGQAGASIKCNRVPLDINGNEHWTGRHGKTPSHQRLRTLEDRQRRTHRRIERPLRQR